MLIYVVSGIIKRITGFGKWISCIGLFLFVSCSDKQVDERKGDPFVLLVYLATDNDLSGEAAQKIEALRQGYNPDTNGRVFIYKDSKKENPCLLELTRKDKAVEVNKITEYNEQNSASAYVFGGVIREVTELSPASGYGLLLFSHASGWLPAGALENPAGVTRSIGRDGTDEMELADFAAAIPDGLFDYIIFEACFMAGIEVMDALKNKTAYILASSAEIVSPGFAPIYPETVSYLLHGKNGLILFAESTFNHYNTQTSWKRSATFSVVRTASIPPLMDFIRTHVPLGEEIDLSGVQPFDRYGRHLFFDLADCYSRLLTEEGTVRLNQLIEDCIVWKAATPSFLQGYKGFTIRAHCGLTTYYPQSYFPGLNTIWQKLITSDS